VTAGDLFLRSGAWPALLAAPVLLVVLVGLGRARARAAKHLIGEHVTSLADGSSTRRRAVKRILFATAILLVLTALLGPTWGNALAAGGRRGVDIVVCLDVSRSMLARDQAPTRLAAAQRAIAELAERARGDRLALVVFAGEAALSVPLTHDGASLVRLAGAASPLSIERGGTDLGAALDTALAALSGMSGEHEAIFLLTDGDDADGRGLAAAGRCAARGIDVHCVGFGSRLGSKIALEGDGGATFLRDAAGDHGVSAMDSDALRRIAEATGSAFRAAVDDSATVVGVYTDEVVPMARKAFEQDEKKERENRFQWPLAAALCLLLLDQSVSERRGS